MFRPAISLPRLPRTLVSNTSRISLSTRRTISSTRARLNRDDAKPGQFARTDPTITIKYPEEKAVPSGKLMRRSKRTLQTFSLEGKVAVVTGGARGLGYVMTQALAESGADVAIVDLNGAEAATAAEKLRNYFKDDDHFPNITSHQSDVSNPTTVKSTISEILSKHNGKIDVLVTAAGICENFKAEEYPYDRMQKMWGINVDGTYLCAAEIARHLIERKSGGSMVFIGSMSGAIVNVPQPQAPYNASKAAVRHLASSFAVEWAAHGIRVNCISPGYMLTAMTGKILEANPDLKAKWTGLTPQGKMGDPQDLAGAVVYLASDASAYVTGADLRIDGGYTSI
ncbi:hypothetical protein RUND412_004703 [Rhizina undulata]